MMEQDFADSDSVGDELGALDFESGMAMGNMFN
jgi:hypothetical protein